MARPPSSRRTGPSKPFVGPDLPPPSEREIEQERELLAMMHDVHAKLIRRNLETAVLLAQQAVRHGGELAAHFGELGRRYGHLLDAPPQSRLRVVKGGAA